MARRSANADCQIMVFRPTMEEFKDFNRYVEYMESQGAHRGGLAKIIPPKEWKPCKSYDHIDELIIPAPISQVVQGQKGLFTQWNIQKKPTTVKEFRKLANTEKYGTPFHENNEDLERKYWKNITFNPAIYGADISGSLYDKDCKEWNVARLNSVLDLVENESGVKIEGVNTAYLYFGMWKSSFAWHTEDMDLYSINYIHFGAPKSWYCVPPEHGKRLERLANGFFPSSYNQCPAFLRHKMTLISPSVLRQYGIPYNKITHEAGEFMITFPYGYHSGFNHGFNCAESTNFASPRWIEYGVAAEKCGCRNDMVFINMDVFMRVFRPKEYEEWKKKKLEIKPVYTDVPEVPDFSKPPIHWRVTAQKIQDEYKKIQQNNTDESKIKKEKIKKSMVKLSPMKTSPSNSLPSPKLGTPKSPTKRMSPPSSANALSPNKCKALSYNQDLQLSSNMVTLTSTQTNLIKDVVKKQKPKKSPFKAAPENSRKPVVKADPLAHLHKAATPSDQSKSITTKDTPSSNDSDYLHPDDEVFLEEGVATIFDRVKMKNRRNSKKKSSSTKTSNSGFMEEFKKAVVNNNKTKKEKTSTTEMGVKESEYLSDSSDSVSDADYTDEKDAATYLSILKNQSTSTAKNKAYALKPSPRPPLKRRHPVSRKGPTKKPSPTVVLNESDNSSENEIKAKSKKSKSHSFKPTEGYPSLWIRRKASFKSERQYNSIVSKLPPYCAICTLFKPYYQIPMNADQQTQPLSSLLETPPELRAGESSKPIIPERNFASTTEEAAPLATCEYLDEHGKSVLLQCANCSVQVHASCYGVRKPPATGEEWCCDRCSFKAWVAQCCLCRLRGGALKPVNDGTKWSHITCAVAIPEVSFDDIPGRNGINIGNIKSIRQKLKCTYCKNSNNSTSPPLGYCVQCCAGRCTMSFHPTCANAAGIPMELADWPFPVFVYCKRHMAVRERKKGKKVPRILAEISDGQQIIGKYRNGRYYECKVLSQSLRIFHHVEFDDKSWSNNVLTEDFVNYDYKANGLPSIDASVDVKWTDGKIYHSLYKGCKKNHMLTVEFENGQVMVIKRTECFVSLDEMPKKLFSKLSTSTKVGS